MQGLRGVTRTNREVIGMEIRERESMFRDYFFFQAEDGIRDYKVTGVQTCALPISSGQHVDPGSHGDPDPALGPFDAPSHREGPARLRSRSQPAERREDDPHPDPAEIGRASCRERV